MKVYVQFLLLSVLLGLCSTAAFADGLPPSEEDDCDVLQLPGVTPGLFGLCNAFCEAKDCDKYADGDMSSSCEGLLANYEGRASDSDPVMPCLQEETVVCPCWPPETERLEDGGMGLPGVGCGVNIPGLGTLAIYDDSEGNAISFAVTPDGCEYMNTMIPDPIELPVSPEEEEVCVNDVLGLQAGEEFDDVDCVVFE